MTDKEDAPFYVILSVSEGSYAGCIFNILEPECYKFLAAIAAFPAKMLPSLVLSSCQISKKRTRFGKRVLLIHFVCLGWIINSTWPVVPPV